MTTPCLPNYRQAVEGMEPKEAIAYLLDCLDTRIDGLGGDLPHELADLDVTPHEGRIFDVLYCRLGKHVAHTGLYNAVYFDAVSADDLPEPKIISVFVCRLRQKLKDQGARFHIETVWGRGYRMVEAE